MIGMFLNASAESAACAAFTKDIAARALWTFGGKISLVASKDAAAVSSSRNGQERDWFKVLGAHSVRSGPQPFPRHRSNHPESLRFSRNQLELQPQASPRSSPRLKHLG